MHKKYVFGYGSLVSKKSIEHTIGRDPGELISAELKGWVRNWSVVLDNSTTIRRFELLPDHQTPHYVAARTVRRPRDHEIAPNPNGVLFEVSDEDIARMDEREDHYVRQDVTSDILGEVEVGSCIYTYVGKDEFCVKENDNRYIILPGSYLKLVESNFDEENLKKFRETTLPAEYPIPETVHSSGI